jgi:uncharacterized membrane protein YkvA (DUF1232 family)
MRISFELDAGDLRRFHEALVRARRLVRSADEQDIVDAAKHALEHLPIANAPSYVRVRVTEVQHLIDMLEDEDWALPQLEREDVLRTLVYFSDPEDLIPDEISVIGLLDDAIMLELLLRRQRHILRGYADFGAARAALGSRPREREARLRHARELCRVRERLHARMRRRHEREKARDRLAS